MDISPCSRGHEFHFHLFVEHDSGRMAGSCRRSFHLALQIRRDTRSGGASMHHSAGHVVHVLLAVQAEHLLEAMNALIESVYLANRRKSRRVAHCLTETTGWRRLPWC